MRGVREAGAVVGLTHDIDWPHDLDRVLDSVSLGQVHDLFDSITCGRVNTVRRAEQSRRPPLFRYRIDRDDLGSFGDSGALDRCGADAARSEDRNGGSGLDLGRPQCRADPRRKWFPKAAGFWWRGD